MGTLSCCQQQFTNSTDELVPFNNVDGKENLIFVFGSPDRIKDPSLQEWLKANCGDSHYVGCTTAGEITANGVEDNTVTLTSLAFDKTEVRTTRAKVNTMDASLDVGIKIAETLNDKDLAYVLILSDGLSVNGSSLVKGIRDTLPSNVPFSGGLAGDADRFEKTYTLDNDGVHENTVIGVGFYGDALHVERGSVGGWAPFGPFRTVTRSTNNIVYEIDNSSALDVYSAYLAEEAKDLPASGLLFPLSMSSNSGEAGLIRTLLAIDRDNGSLTFAGDVHEGSTVQLMHANYDQLIQGAENAAADCLKKDSAESDFALLISCVGRKLLLGHNTDLEVDAVSSTLGRNVTCAGFYSYGEIGLLSGSNGCEFHNQTMTLTILREES